MYPALFDTEHFFQKLLRLNPTYLFWQISPDKELQNRIRGRWGVLSGRCPHV